MDIPAQNWYGAITNRRSRRQFDQSKSIPEEILSRLESVCSKFKPFKSARSQLVTEHCDDVFKGVVGAYGKIKCAKAFIAFIGDLSDKYVQEQVGYTGEGIILEATSLKLATCWVGGFKANVVNSLLNKSSQERVLAVTPVGYVKEHETLEERFMASFGRNHERKPLATITTGLTEEKWPAWLKTSLEAARKAPSAINRQPWSFDINANALTISIRTHGLEFNVSKRLDCGIAMLNFHVASLFNGIEGTWEFLDSPSVARFTPKTMS